MYQSLSDFSNKIVLTYHVVTWSLSQKYSSSKDHGPIELWKRFDDSSVIFSLSNYSSGGFSNKSSLNDSGVVGDQEMDSVSEDKLRLQVSVQLHNTVEAA